MQVYGCQPLCAILFIYSTESVWKTSAGSGNNTRYDLTDKGFTEENVTSPGPCYSQHQWQHDTLTQNVTLPFFPEHTSHVNHSSTADLQYTFFIYCCWKSACFVKKTPGNHKCANGCIFRASDIFTLLHFFICQTAQPQSPAKILSSTEPDVLWTWRYMEISWWPWPVHNMTLNHLNPIHLNLGFRIALWRLTESTGEWLKTGKALVPYLTRVGIDCLHDFVREL